MLRKLTASTRLPALPCDSEPESFPRSEGTVSDTGRGALCPDTLGVGLGLDTGLFPLLSLYLESKQVAYYYTSNVNQMVIVARRSSRLNILTRAHS